MGVLLYMVQRQWENSSVYWNILLEQSLTAYVPLLMAVYNRDDAGVLLGGLTFTVSVP